jgi:hypothetical protein
LLGELQESGEALEAEQTRLAYEQRYDELEAY